MEQPATPSLADLLAADVTLGPRLALLNGTPAAAAPMETEVSMDSPEPPPVDASRPTFLMKHTDWHQDQQAKLARQKQIGVEDATGSFASRTSLLSMSTSSSSSAATAVEDVLNTTAGQSEADRIKWSAFTPTAASSSFVFPHSAVSALNQSGVEAVMNASGAEWTTDLRAKMMQVQ